MILIIDNYEIPFELIKKNLYKNKEFIEIKKLNFELFNDFVVRRNNYFLHSECFTDSEIEEICFYFDEIVDIKNQLIRVKRKDKSFDKKFIYYQISKNGKNTNFILLRDDLKITNNEKNEFLPYLEAQSGEVVLFPSDEE
ncbi:hypothetical protein DMUE_2934 [Dictyocoela muelleri]|nr:hypothetical protein DMUE_2934 [Dictyocoela muelleri]